MTEKEYIIPQEKMTRESPTIALDMLYVKTMNIYPAFISKRNSSHDHQIIPNGDG